MSKRKQLVEKIIREEMTGYAKKILDERKDTGMHRNGNEPGFTQGMGLRGGSATLPEPEPNRAIAPNKKRSTVTSIIDEPDLNRHFVEEKISDRLEEEASESDSKDYGVNTTSAAPAGGDDTGKIEHVPGYPLDSDMDVQSEATFRRWKQLALMGEGVDDAEFDAELETLAPPVYVDPATGMESTPPDIDIEAPSGPPGVDLPTPDTPDTAGAPGGLDALGTDLSTAGAGAEADMSAIGAPGGGNLMDMSKQLFGADFKPAAGMFNMDDMGAPPMDMGMPTDPAQVEADVDDQVGQLEFESPDAMKEAIRRVLKEKLLT